MGWLGLALLLENCPLYNYSSNGNYGCEVCFEQLRIHWVTNYLSMILAGTLHKRSRHDHRWHHLWTADSNDRCSYHPPPLVETSPQRMMSRQTCKCNALEQHSPYQNASMEHIVLLLEPMLRIVNIILSCRFTKLQQAWNDWSTAYPQYCLEGATAASLPLSNSNSNDTSKNAWFKSWHHNFPCSGGGPAGHYTGGSGCFASWLLDLPKPKVSWAVASYSDLLWV